MWRNLLPTLLREMCGEIYYPRYCGKCVEKFISYVILGNVWRNLLPTLLGEMCGEFFYPRYCGKCVKKFITHVIRENVWRNFLPTLLWEMCGEIYYPRYCGKCVEKFITHVIVGNVWRNLLPTLLWEKCVSYTSLIEHLLRPSRSSEGDKSHYACLYSLLFNIHFFFFFINREVPHCGLGVKSNFYLWLYYLSRSGRRSPERYNKSFIE